MVFGCLASLGTQETFCKDSNVYVVENKESLSCELLRILFSRSETGFFDESAGPDNTHDCYNRPNSQLNFGPLRKFKGHVRAFVKVQDGCDGICSYCIIPRTRPVVRSRDKKEVLAEVRQLVKAGHKEIVLTGIFLGAYGEESVRRNKWINGRGEKLIELLEEMAGIVGLSRIRLSSLEPGDVSRELLEVMSSHRNIMAHLHLSVQSGSESVLRRMCRQYNAAELFLAVARIKKYFERPAITADIMVGFPGENSVDFSDTFSLAEEAGFSKMHVFGFSARPGTAAAKMGGQVSREVIKERSRKLRRLDGELQRRFRRQFIGEETEILSESSGPKVRGRTEHYFPVELIGEQDYPKNELIRVRLVRESVEGVFAEPAGAGSRGIVRR